MVLYKLFSPTDSFREKKKLYRGDIEKNTQRPPALGLTARSLSSASMLRDSVGTHLLATTIALILANTYFLNLSYSLAPAKGFDPRAQSLTFSQLSAEEKGDGRSRLLSLLTMSLSGPLSHGCALLQTYGFSRYAGARPRISLAMQYAVIAEL